MQIWEFDNLHMTQCAKVIVGFMANVGNVFLSNVYKSFFLFSPRFLTFFLIFISTFITSMAYTCRCPSKSSSTCEDCLVVVVVVVHRGLVGRMMSLVAVQRAARLRDRAEARSVPPGVCPSSLQPAVAAAGRL